MKLFFINNANALIYQDDESRHNVHKMVLACKSKFFDDLFVANNDNWTFTISCVSDKAMKVILDAFYGIECSEVLEPEIRQEIIDVSKEIECKVCFNQVMNIKDHRNNKIYLVFQYPEKND